MCALSNIERLGVGLVTGKSAGPVGLNIIKEAPASTRTLIETSAPSVSKLRHSSPNKYPPLPKPNPNSKPYH